jgi:hypothetical protein
MMCMPEFSGVKIVVSYDVTLSNLLNWLQHLWRKLLPQSSTLRMEAVGFFEKLVHIHIYICQTI